MTQTHATAHGHDLNPNDSSGNRRRLAISLALTLSVFVIQVIGALWSGSIALLADSAHVLTDGTGLTLAVIAATLAARPATHKRTFGWKRAEILAAGVNGLLMLGISVYVIIEGIKRFAAPPEVDSPIMLAAAGVGLAVNLAVMALLFRNRKTNLNIRGAYLEVWGDMLGSVLVIVAGLLIATTGFMQADAIASLIVGALILPRAVSLLRQAGHVLLEASPEGMDVEELRKHLAGIPGVTQVHDLHVWTISSGMPSLTVHAQIDAEHADEVASGVMLRRFQECTREHFDLTHATFQLEVDGPTECVADQTA